MQKQKTIKNNIFISGIGLHKGLLNTITIAPAPVNTGIVFEIDKQRLQPSIQTVNAEHGNTYIGDLKGKHIKTIEHLMSAICGNDIDNLIIKIDGEEIPILDGSALIFTKEFEEKAGIIEQDEPRKYLKILTPIEFKNESGEVSISPNDNNILNLDITIDYSDIKPIGIEREIIDLTNDNYKNIICKARTFARLSDVEFLHSKGLALGASINTGIAVDNEKVLNKEGLRFKNEFVFHKILDAIGDLFISGYRIIGKYKSFKGGHIHNNQLVKKILSDTSNYKIVEL